MRSKLTDKTRDAIRERYKELYLKKWRTTEILKAIRQEYDVSDRTIHYICSLKEIKAEAGDA